MQTFHVYPDYQQTADCLDYKRLNKQRSETYQLLLGQYPYHPAATMWEGYYNSLVEYGIIMCETHIRRGYDDGLLDTIKNLYQPKGNKAKPPWTNDLRVINSHRSSLLKKDFLYYCQFGWNVPTFTGYFWPRPLDYLLGLQ